MSFVGYLLAQWAIRKLQNHYAQSATRRERLSRPVSEKREVFYSSHSFASGLRHVALFVDRTKYEVKRDEESEEIKFSKTYYPGRLPFPLYLAPSTRDRLQFKMIGRTALNDSQIAQVCDILAKGFVYDLLSNNCQDFAFLIAYGLIREEDRSEFWDILFGPKDYQLSVLAKVEGREIPFQLAEMASAQNYAQSDPAAQGGGVDFGGAGDFPASVHLGGGGGFAHHGGGFAHHGGGFAHHAGGFAHHAGGHH